MANGEKSCIMGKQWKQWQTLFSWAPKSLQMVTAACTLGKKAMANLDSIKKQRHYCQQVPSGQSYDFPSSHVWMWVWTIKKAEHQRIDAFELWCWRRLLRVPWTARRSNHSILKKISPEYSLEGLLLKLKLQSFDHQCKKLTPWKRLWCWERLKAGGGGYNSGLDGWHHQLDEHEFEQAPGIGDGQGSLVCWSPWGHKESDTTEWLNWTTWHLKPPARPFTWDTLINIL